jgi:preprotein translocase subunit SecG
VLTFITVIHVITCILLVTTILMQSGKGGGLAQGFDSAENLLGAQTNMFMVKVTTTLAVIFLCTCIGIALLTTKKQRSLLADMPEKRRGAETVNVEKLFDQKPSQTIVINAAGDSAK